MKRTIAFVLVCLLTLQIAAFGASAAADKKAYTGEILAAINTNYNDVTQDFAAQSTASGAVYAESQTDVAAAEDDWVDGPQTDEPKPLSAAEALQMESLYGNLPQEAAEYTVGMHKTIRSSYRDNYDTNKVDLECIYISDYCTVWREDGISNSEEECIRLAERFESLLPTEWELFGDHRIDPDGDGRIALLFYDMNDVGGYFSRNDLIDAHRRIGSVWMASKGTGNAIDCVHLCEHSDINTLLHEYQHYLHAGWKYDGKNNLTIKENSNESYINEGFSGCAEDLIGTHNRAGSFSNAASDPTEFSLVNWHFDSRSYSISYVFCQYLRTRYALLTNDLDSPIPGSGIFKKILQTRSEKLVRNTLSIAANILYPREDYPQLKTVDSRCRQLLTDFWLAALRKEDKGIYGFNGEAWADCIELEVRDQLPADGSPLIRSGMAVFYLIPYADPAKGAYGEATVTRAGSEFVFCGVENVGRLLVLDWQDDSIPDEYTLSRQDSVTLSHRDAHVSGRSMLGWAETPDAQSVELIAGNKVALSEDAPTVLYAVWTDAQTLTTAKAVTIERCSCNCVRFTPDEDGYYLFSWNYGSLTDACVGGESLRAEPKATYSSSQACYALRAGEMVELFFDGGGKYTDHLRVKRVTQQFALQYIYTLGDAQYTAEAHGYTSYYLMEPDEEVLTAARREGVRFAGWAEEPSAEKAKYTANTVIRLTEDKTLYAVWQEIPAIAANDEQTLQTENSGWIADVEFAFTPDSSGTYQFLCLEAEPGSYQYLTIYNAEGRKVCKCSPSKPQDGVWTLTLQAGRQYTFLYTAEGVSDDQCTVRMDKISDAPSAKLTFSAKEESDTVMGAWNRIDEIVLKGRYDYTVPRLDPCARDSRVCVGWQEYTYDFDAHVLKAGDVYEPIVDRTLYPVWEKKAQTRLSASGFSYGLRAIRFVLQLLGLFMKEIAHIEVK